MDVRDGNLDKRASATGSGEGGIDERESERCSKIEGKPFVKKK